MTFGIFHTGPRTGPRSRSLFRGLFIKKRPLRAAWYRAVQTRRRAIGSTASRRCCSSGRRA
eukprot:1714780-Alexandrium_andersonii.AAC.1